MRLIEHLYTRGAEGVYINGSSGEGYTLEEETRRRVNVVAVEVWPWARLPAALPVCPQLGVGCVRVCVCS